MYCDNQIKIGISFSPYGNTFGRYGQDKFLKIKQHGYDAIDYNLSNTNTELYSLCEDDLKQKISAEKNFARRADITISQVHGPWRWPPRDGSEQEREERLNKMKRAVIITALLGCNNLVIHPIMPYGIEDLKYGKDQETWDLNVEFFKSLLDFAKQYDVTICLENMPMRLFSLAKPDRILEFVKTINSDHLKICLDTGHVAIFPELSMGDEVRRLGDYIKVLHIHDNMGDADLHLYPTKGIIDWTDFFNALNEIGYNGVFSLETAPSGDLADEHFEAESINLCQMLKKLIVML